MSKGDKKLRRAFAAYDTLQRSASLAASRVDGALHLFGLSASQYGTLNALQERGPAHQQELALGLGRSKAQMTAIVDALEGRGLVRRERHADDRRFISIYLTDAGRQAWRHATPKRTEAIIGVMSELSSEQRARLTRLCRRLLKALDPRATQAAGDIGADDIEKSGDEDGGCEDASEGGNEDRHEPDGRPEMTG